MGTEWVGGIGMFERYYREGSEWIPREDLYVVTKIKLKALENELGYQFDGQARKAQFGHAPSYLIYGESPDGKELIYERRETNSREGSRTLLWVDGKRHDILEFIQPPKSFTQVQEELVKKIYFYEDGGEAPTTEEILKDLGVDIEGLHSGEIHKMGDLLSDMGCPRPREPWSSWRDWKEEFTKEERKEVKRQLKEYREKVLGEIN